MSSEQRPWRVVVTRGEVVESEHAVSVVVRDAAGDVVVRAGDVERAVFGRSALKPAQAVAVLGAGADLTDDEVAIAAGSHSGEPVHLEAVRALLARHGLGPADLRCPADLPLDPAAAHALLAAGGSASPLAMNCSGKHAAMLATGAGPGYADAGGPLQVAVRDAVERLVGPVRASSVDGCGLPAFATALADLATLLPRLLAAPEGTPEHRVAAAMRARPDLVAGSGRLDTAVMTAWPGAVCKVGAEGVLVAAWPGGPALALKVHDGASRPVGPVLGEVLRRSGTDLSTCPVEALSPRVTGGGHQVGDLRVQV